MNRALACLAALVCWGWALASGAASGTWTNRSGGSWTNAGNWNAGVIADGSGGAVGNPILVQEAEIFRKDRGAANIHDIPIGPEEAA